MELTNFLSSLRPIKRGSALVILGILISVAFLTHRYSSEIDISANQRNTLAIATQNVLSRLSKPVTIEVYLKTGDPLRKLIEELIHRYQRLKPDIDFKFIDPTQHLDKAKALGIGAHGLIVVNYQGRSEKINYLDEFSLTNALLQLTEGQQRWVSFLTGHGERSPIGVANFDLGDFAKELQRQQIKSQRLNLAEIGGIPDNSNLLVIAAPRVALLAGELQLIQHYIQQGGNLLLLTDPDSLNLTAIEQYIGIRQLDGTIFDENAKIYGIDDPSFVVVSQYQRHPLTQGMQNMTVYPTAVGLATDKKAEFQNVALFNSSEQSWLSNSANNAVKQRGAIPIAYALTREFKQKQQRIIVVGDGDFLSNTFLGNVGNRELGIRMFNWLTANDHFIEIPIKTAVGHRLQFTPLAVGIIGFGFLLVLPLIFMLTGFFIWRMRKRH